jgi:hypothetical protein
MPAGFPTLIKICVDGAPPVFAVAGTNLCMDVFGFGTGWGEQILVGACGSVYECAK